MNNSLVGKKIAALDVGTKRIGYAICDELHISVTPKLFFDSTRKDLYEIINTRCENDGVAALIVGIPLTHNDEDTRMSLLIKEFCFGLQQMLQIPVIQYDESFSTKEAWKTMALTGFSKRRKREKGQKDMIAAAIILRNFLEELKNNV